MEITGEIRIAFDVYSNSPQSLTIFDNSDWVYASTLPAYISITPPGRRAPKTYSFSKNKINNFNSHNLGISCLSGDCTEEVYIDLADGIYTICLQSSYEDIQKTKYYLKTDVFELEYDKVLVKYGFEYNEQDELFIKDMTKVKFLLSVAKANAKLGDVVKAQRFFQEAKMKLKRYVECKDCL